MPIPLKLAYSGVFIVSDLCEALCWRNFRLSITPCKQIIKLCQPESAINLHKQRLFKNSNSHCADWKMFKIIM